MDVTHSFSTERNDWMLNEMGVEGDRIVFKNEFGSFSIPISEIRQFELGWESVKSRVRELQSFQSASELSVEE